jgi:Arm DNA-binding domain
MRGHVRKRGTTWTVVYDEGHDENGRRRQRWKSGFATRREAEGVPDGNALPARRRPGDQGDGGEPRRRGRNRKCGEPPGRGAEPTRQAAFRPRWRYCHCPHTWKP